MSRRFRHTDLPPGLIISTLLSLVLWGLMALLVILVWAI